MYLALTKKQRLAQFDKLRKEGIIIYNRKIQGSKSDLMRERRQENKDLVISRGCEGFFSAKEESISTKRNVQTKVYVVSKIWLFLKMSL